MTERFDIAKIDPAYALGRAAAECAKLSASFEIDAGGFLWELRPINGCVLATYSHEGGDKLQTYVRIPRLTRGRAPEAYREIASLGRRMLQCARAACKRESHRPARCWLAPQKLTSWMDASIRRALKRALDSGEREEVVLQVDWGKLILGMKESGESIVGDWLFVWDSLEIEGEFRVPEDATSRQFLRRAIECANNALLERGESEQINLQGI